MTHQFGLKEPENDTTVCAHHRHTAQLCRKDLKLCLCSMPLCCFISNLLIYFPLTESAREIRGVAFELRDTGVRARLQRRVASARTLAQPHCPRVTSSWRRQLLWSSRCRAEKCPVKLLCRRSGSSAAGCHDKSLQPGSTHESFSSR